MLKMFRALLCPSSGAHDYSADYHMGRPVIGLLLVGSQVQTVWISVRAAGCNTTIITLYGPVHIKSVKIYLLNLQSGYILLRHLLKVQS